MLQFYYYYFLTNAIGFQEEKEEGFIYDCYCCNSNNNIEDKKGKSCLIYLLIAFRIKIIKLIRDKIIKIIKRKQIEINKYAFMLLIFN